MSDAVARRYIGAGVARVEDERLLRGRGRFVDDIDLPGTLHVAFLRSAHANARISDIDVSVALTMAGVQLVLTGDDLGDPQQTASGLRARWRDAQPAHAATSCGRSSPIRRRDHRDGGRE